VAHTGSFGVRCVWIGFTGGHKGPHHPSAPRPPLLYTGYARSARLDHEDHGVQNRYGWREAQKPYMVGATLVVARPFPPTFLIILPIIAGSILLTYTLTEEVTRSIPGFHIYALIVNWLSLAAQCCCFGVLACCAYVLLPLLPTMEPASRADLLRYWLRRISPVVLLSSGALAVCELYLSQVSLGNIQQLITEPYGHALLVQWVLIIIVLIVDGYVFFVLYPRLNKPVASHPKTVLPAQPTGQTSLDRITNRFRETFSTQAWLGGAVLFCTALLTFFATPGTLLPTNTSQSGSPGPTLTATPPNTLRTQTKEVGNLSVTLTVTPAQTNVINTVTVKLTDRRSGQPVMNAHIEISTNMEIMDMGTVRATMTANGPVYRATFQPFVTFSMSGVWDLTLTLQLPGQAPQKVVFGVLFLSGS
jgi:hypothetical protein